MTPPYLLHLGLDGDADERAVRRAYARLLKQIDQETQADAFQALRDAYEACLRWVTARAADPQPAAEPAEPAAARQAPAAPAVEQAQQQAHQQAQQRTQHSQALARTALQPLEERLQAGQVRSQQDAETLLDAALGSPELTDMDARFFFEWCVAALLAQGWRPGHDLLFGPAMERFRWDAERNRLRDFGRAGEIVDAAIAEMGVYEGLPYQARIPERALIRRLREGRRPSTGELVRLMPQLERLLARYPHWLHLVTDGANVRRWRELDREVPAWRRWIGLRRLTVARVKADAPAGRPWWRQRWAWVLWLIVGGNIVSALLRLGEPEPQVQPPVVRPPAPAFVERLPGSASGVPGDAYVVPPRVVYPAAARRAGQQGTAVVGVSVGRDGRPQDVRVESSSGYPLLDEAAADAVRAAVFPMRLGEVATARYRLPVRFTLDDAPSTDRTDRTGRPAWATQPHRSYGERVSDAVRPFIVFDAHEVPGNPVAEVEVRLRPDGAIAGRSISRSSGYPGWDAAVLKALDKAGRVPVDDAGKVPPVMVMSFRPRP